MENGNYPIKIVLNIIIKNIEDRYSVAKGKPMVIEDNEEIVVFGFGEITNNLTNDVLYGVQLVISKKIQRMVLISTEKNKLNGLLSMKSYHSETDGKVLTVFDITGDIVNENNENMIDDLTDFFRRLK